MNRVTSRYLAIIFLLISSMGLTGCKLWTVVENEKTNDDGSLKIYFADGDFDVEKYVTDIWDNKMNEYYAQHKVDDQILVKEMKANPNQAGEQYGIGSNDIGLKWSFVMEGVGKIVEVNTESRAGIMTLDTKPYDGVADLTVQIGPVIKGSSVRDSLDFIKLDDFSNQVEFASISKALNAKIMTNVIGSKDFKKDIGKEVRYLGCFTFAEDGSILLTPIELKDSEGN